MNASRVFLKAGVVGATGFLLFKDSIAAAKEFRKHDRESLGHDEASRTHQDHVGRGRLLL